MICPHLGIAVVNSTETNAIPVENESTNGASTFWGKLIISILFYFKSNLNFQITCIGFNLNVFGPACFYRALRLRYHLQSTNELAGFRSSNFFLSINKRKIEHSNVLKLYLGNLSNCSCVVSSDGCCYSVGSCDYYLIERSEPTIPNRTLVPSWRCQCSLFTGKCAVIFVCTQVYNVCACVCVCVCKQS